MNQNNNDTKLRKEKKKKNNTNLQAILRQPTYKQCLLFMFISLLSSKFTFSLISIYKHYPIDIAEFLAVCRTHVI